MLLYAQPIRNKEGEGYDEILARLKYDGGIMTPDKFLPLIAQFNLSARFDLQVLESLLKWLATHPCDKKRPALFSQFNAAHAAAKEYCRADYSSV